jgi:hypothetical protein
VSDDGDDFDDDSDYDHSSYPDDYVSWKYAPSYGYYGGYDPLWWYNYNSYPSRSAYYKFCPYNSAHFSWYYD